MRRRWGWPGRLAALLLAGAAIWIGVEIWTWPAVARLVTERPATTAFIEAYRARQRAMGRPDRVAWTWTPYATISPAVKRAVLVAEDIGFFSHRGFALDEIHSALEDALREGELPRGASTLTQQLAKNLWLSPSRSPLRKAREAVLTWQLERALSKRRILELYLNVAEFGPGLYGVGAASRHYFGKAAADVDEREAAQLAAALPSPASWHPGSSRPGYLRHVAAIERRMARATFLWKQISLRHDAPAGPGHRRERARPVGRADEVGGPHVPLEPGPLRLPEAGDVGPHRPIAVEEGPPVVGEVGELHPDLQGSLLDVL
jgi:monofunctional biosynthetic peptidoglycan transglycosylase